MFYLSFSLFSKNTHSHVFTILHKMKPNIDSCIPSIFSSHHGFGTSHCFFFWLFAKEKMQKHQRKDEETQPRPGTYDMLHRAQVECLARPFLVPYQILRFWGCWHLSFHSVVVLVGIFFRFCFGGFQFSFAALSLSSS